jgi:serine phosphatase RsbU (regulator of sigma subunit)
VTADRQAAGGSEETLAVLLVEDDDEDALLVAEELEEALPNCEIVRSRTLAEALSHPPEGIDCILLDLGLPDTSGLEAVIELRSRLAVVPLVVLTGRADDAVGVAAVQAGAQDYLVKGRLEPGELARAIRYAIGRRETEEAERELLLAEMQAREVERLERGLSPPPLLDDPGVWAAARNRPGRSRAVLGGDFFDLVQLPGGRLHAVIGDVCGHGTDEAALGVGLRAAWRALTMSGVSQPRTLETLQRLFEHERHPPRLFVTLCTIEIDLAERLAKLVMAGHPSPLLIEDDGVRPLSDSPGATPIGLGGGPWRAEPVTLPEAWTLLLYTDGIVEGRVGAGSERLGVGGLCRLVSAQVFARPAWREHAEELLAGLIAETEAMNAGPLGDDVALLLVGSGGGTLPR